jgi:hypothetical protein
MSDLTEDVIEVILKHLTDRLALAALFLSLILLVAMFDSGDRIAPRVRMLSACLSRHDPVVECRTPAESMPTIARIHSR